MQKVLKSCGNGLSLYQLESGQKAWRFKYTFEGVRTCLSLGDFNFVSEEEARKRADECYKILAFGKNPRLNRSWLKPKNQYGKEYLIEKLKQKMTELQDIIDKIEKNTKEC